MSVDCRSQMEIEATQKAIDFISGLIKNGDVPESEFILQEGMTI